MGNYKIVKSKNGVKILNHNKMVELKNIDYQEILSIFEPEHIHTLGKNFLSVIRQKMQDQEKIYDAKQVYSLGTKILLISNSCKKCLALQFPFSTLEHYQLPHFLKHQTFSENKQVVMDEYGLVGIHSLMDISHVACCPVDKQEIHDIMSEGEIDERYLRDPILTKVVTNFSFTHEGVWKIEANIFGTAQLFLGISKPAVIEKLYTYILKRFYHYNGYGIGLTANSAYLDLQRNYIANHFCLDEKYSIDVNNMLQELRSSLHIGRAFYQKIKDERLPFYVTEVVVKDRPYKGIGFSLKECLIDIMEQLVRGRSATQKKKFDWNGNMSLYRYRDALSERYEFIILGKG